MKEQNTRIPSNCEVTDAKCVGNNEISVTLKSPCRHYSGLDVKIEAGEVKVIDSKNRCGLTNITR